MRRALPFASLALVFPLVLASASCSSAPYDAGADFPHREVLDVLHLQTLAWNKGDIEGFLRGYRNHSSTTFISNGDRTIGFEAVAARFRGRYGSGNDTAGMGRLEFSENAILRIDEDDAVVNGRFALDRGTEKGVEWGRFTVVMRKFPDYGWQIVHDHTSTPIPEPEVTPGS